MKPTAPFPTSYGVSVLCFDHPSEPGEYIFSMEATAICVGIFDPEERARFVADCTAANRCDMGRLGVYGGGVVPRVPIAKPLQAAYSQTSRGEDFAIPIENWITAITDVYRWCDRAEKLIEIIEVNFSQIDKLGYGAGFEPILALGLQTMLTGALEHLAKSEIDCLEAAAFYTLSTQSEWSKPALKWLLPMSDTWFADWTRDRPVYRRFARLCQLNSGLPAWIAGCRS